MKVESSKYLKDMKSTFQKLLKELLSKYEYASIIASDVECKNYGVSARGINVSESNEFGKRAFNVRVYDKKGYAEYSSVSLKDSDIPEVLSIIENKLVKSSSKYERLETPVSDDEKVSFDKATDYEIDPSALGDEAIIKKLSDLRTKAIAMDSRFLDANCRFNYQKYHKLFLSRNKDLEQNVLYSDIATILLARKDQEVKDSYKAFSCLGGAEVMNQMEAALPEMKKNIIDLLDSQPMVPGEYECICTPPVTGMIVHEAFGHGVEMDMFVKDRALAKQYMGKRVASDLVTMRDGANTGYEDVATFFFDDEGTIASDTLVIDKGILVSGYADEVSAKRLGVKATGNGRRESLDHKTYTRMTNTYFLEGNDEVEDMIASIKYGFLLDEPSSGMEDPKNWGIQLMVSFAREIKDGKFTGKIFSPIVMSGYVPDLLNSISMISKKVEHCGSGYCGKGYKEYVKVSDGGPYIKARIRLG